MDTQLCIQDDYVSVQMGNAHWQEIGERERKRHLIFSINSRVAMAVFREVGEPEFCPIHHHTWISLNYPQYSNPQATGQPLSKIFFGTHWLHVHKMLIVQ